jgi:hypothetical protein
MPLTFPEVEFIESFIDEYMALEMGPASCKLRERGLLGAEILHLLDAYSRAHPPRLEKKEIDGVAGEVLVYGRPIPSLPDPPWPDAETARRRNAEILAEREAKQ